MSSRMRRAARPFAACGLALLLLAPPAWAESRSDASLGFVLTEFSQFDQTTSGVELSVSRRLSHGLALDAQLDFSPSDLSRPAFSDSQFSGFLGLRAGTPIGSARAFAAVRPGFVRLAEAPAPFACIAIFPPPLVCSLGGGKTLFGLQLAGGLEVFPSRRTVVRVEAGSLLVRYPGPALTSGLELFQDSLWSHNLRATLSIGLRF